MFDRLDVLDRWGAAVPHIERINGFDTWAINGNPWAKPGNAGARLDRVAA